MLRDTLTLVGFAVAIIAITALGTLMAGKSPADIDPIETTPEPVAQTSEPKHTPQVLFVVICGSLVGIMVTTEPMLFASAERPITPEMETLVKAAIAANLAYQFDGGGGFCDGGPIPQPDFRTQR